MKRMKVLFGQRRFQVLITLAVIMLVVGSVLASGANFTATSANPGNVFTAGALSIGNFKSNGTTANEGQLIENLTAANMKPGDAATVGTAVIKNSGSIPGTFTLTGSISAGDATFASKLHCVISEDGTQIYTGTLAGVLGNATLLAGGVWPAGAQHTFVFTVNYPDGGSGGADNAQMGKSCTAGFQWNAVQ